MVCCVGCKKDMPFTTEEWKAKPGDTPYNHRIYHVEDLMSKHLFVGMDRKEVVEMLGEPDKDNGGVIRYIIYEDYTISDIDPEASYLGILLNDNSKLLVIYRDDEE